MDVIAVGKGAGVVLRYPKGAIQQRFSIFVPRGYAHRAGPASPRYEKTAFAFRNRLRSYDLLFSILKAISVSVRSCHEYCRGSWIV